MFDINLFAVGDVVNVKLRKGSSYIKTIKNIVSRDSGKYRPGDMIVEFVDSQVDSNCYFTPKSNYLIQASFESEWYGSFDNEFEDLVISMDKV